MEASCGVKTVDWFGLGGCDTEILDRNYMEVIYIRE